MLRWEFLFFTRGAHDPSIQTCARKYFSLELIIRNFTDCLKRDEIPKCTLECCTGTIRPGMCTYLFYSVREVICHPESRQQAHKLRPLDPRQTNRQRDYDEVGRNYFFSPLLFCCLFSYFESNFSKDRLIKQYSNYLKMYTLNILVHIDNYIYLIKYQNKMTPV